MKRTGKQIKRYTAWARKDGKLYSTTLMTYSNAAAKRCALEMYPPEKGYTDHFGQRRIG
jgi:hypothetical protein